MLIILQGKKILKILKKFFKHATEDCLKAAVKKCKKHWYNPAKVVQCAVSIFEGYLLSVLIVRIVQL